MVKPTLVKAVKKTTQIKSNPAVLLDEQLTLLQGECDVVEARLVGSRNELYKSIARVYFWWRLADAQKGYLDVKIDQMGAVFKVTSKHGYNFSPVLQLVYGNSIDDPEISKRGRVLNLLHEEYKKTPKKYGVDVVKLAGYISQMGGINKLVQSSMFVPSLKTLQSLSTKKQPLASGHADTFNDIDIAKQAAMDAEITAELSEAEMLAELVKEYGHTAVFIRKPKPLDKVRLSATVKQSKLAAHAEAYWKRHSGLGLIDAEFGFDTDINNFGLAVVKRDVTGVSLVSSFVDSELIKQALTAAYQQQYAALPTSLRCLYETLKTQLLPDHVMNNMAGKWDDGCVKKLSWETKKGKNVSVQAPVKAMPRLVHMGDTNMFLLSPIATDVGVVTLAVAKQTVLAKHGHDVSLVPRSKASLERLILNAGNINCYRPSDSAHIPKAGEPYSHRIQLTSIADPSDFYFVDFYPFVASAPANYGQVMLDMQYAKKIKTKTQLTPAFVHTVAKNAAEKWLSGKGNHASRVSNRYVQLTINSKSLRLDFDYKDGQSLAHFEFGLPSSTKVQIMYQQKFVCLDLVPLLSAMGALQLTSDVELQLDANVAIFKFSTVAADYVIAAPTCNDQGNRVNSAAFYQRMPNSQPLSLDERMDITLERYYASNPEDMLIDLDFEVPKQIYEYD